MKKRLTWQAALLALAVPMLLAVPLPQVPGVFPLSSRAAQAEPALQQRFQQWLEQEIWPQARKAGISRAVFERALRPVRLNLKLPDLVLPGRPAIPPEQQQAEFASPARYFRESSLKVHTRRGQALLKRHAALLQRVEQRFGVPGAVVLAIWARESNYGRAAIPHDALSILATQAYLGRRRQMFRRELLAALQMLQRGMARRDMLKSSWAGALGQPQMMPSVYLRDAVDFDGDGRRDIWRSVPDVLASIANHLRAGGWRRGLHWGVEVKLPRSVPCHLEGPDQGRTLAQWMKAGIRPLRGEFPAHWKRQKALFLLTPAGRLGPAFLVSANFYALKEYNYSDLYALYIGHLADRISGRVNGPFRTRWQEAGRLTRADVACMQRQLQRMGHDVGGVDGLAGFRTRRSIGRFEESRRMQPSCFPTPALRRALCARRGDDGR